jgi:hypothetical protein
VIPVRAGIDDESQMQHGFDVFGGHEPAQRLLSRGFGEVERKEFSGRRASGRIQIDGNDFVAGKQRRQAAAEVAGNSGDEKAAATRFPLRCRANLPHRAREPFRGL